MQALNNLRWDDTSRNAASSTVTYKSSLRRDLWL